MSEKNKMIVMKFINEFVNGNIEASINYLSDDIKWNIVGMPSINGKQNFLRAMKMMGLWQTSPNENIPSNDGRENIIAEGDFVVIENFDDLINKNGDHNNPAHCDIYRVENGKIKEVTTYVVDISINE